MRKEIEEKTISKFKGINASRSGATFEAFGPAEDQLIDISNFNINPALFLEKRWGVQEVSRITSPANPAYLRIIGTQRGSQIGISLNRSYNYVILTDNARVWRVNIETGSYEEILQSNYNPVANLRHCVEYGGTTSSSAYQVVGVRQGTGITGAAGGILYIDPNSNTAGGTGVWYPNTPVGTFGLIFKDRLFVINSNGSTELTGNETKVWYSAVGNPADFGGVAMNNFNLDFGDGDYLTTAIPFNDQLYFFKTQKTYVVGVDGAPADWNYRIASDRVGCVGRSTVKIIDGKMYFLSLEGVVRFDGAQAELISENITDLLETYRDYKFPDSVMDMYASHWQNKYILWQPRDTGEGMAFDSALVYDIPSSTWSKWTLTNGVQAFSEARFSDLTIDSLFLGANYTAGAKHNRLWKMSDATWTDDGVSFPCTFRTKKYDFGQPMTQKRLHSVGLTVKNEPVEGSSAQYQVTTVSDNSFGYSTAEPPAKFSVMNLKAKGAGYGRYFYSTVSLTNSLGYAAVYDLTFLAEDRGLIPYSRPVGSKVEQIPTANIFKAGPGNNDRLTSGFILR